MTRGWKVMLALYAVALIAFAYAAGAVLAGGAQ